MILPRITLHVELQQAPRLSEKRTRKTDTGDSESFSLPEDIFTISLHKVEVRSEFSMRTVPARSKKANRDAENAKAASGGESTHATNTESNSVKLSSSEDEFFDLLSFSSQPCSSSSSQSLFMSSSQLSSSSFGKVPGSPIPEECEPNLLVEHEYEDGTKHIALPENQQDDIHESNDSARSLESKPTENDSKRKEAWKSTPKPSMQQPSIDAPTHTACLELIDTTLRAMMCNSCSNLRGCIRRVKTNFPTLSLSEVCPSLFSPGYLHVCYWKLLHFLYSPAHSYRK